MSRRIQSLDELRRPPPVAAATGRTASTGRIRILGIDPGSRITGWGLVEVQGHQLRYLAHGCIRTGEGPLAPRLLTIHQALAAVIAEHQPQEYAVEEVFMRVNVGSALVLGQARGVAVLAGAAAGLPFSEYAPAQIKRAVVGSGRADKTQIQHMVKLLLKVPGAIAADAADALAIAICHAHVRGTLSRGNALLKGSWG